MDVVKFWSDTISNWNADNKCGLCWEFDAPLKESQSNIVQNGEGCCVSVLLTGRRLKNVNQFHPITNFIIKKFKEITIDLHFVMKGDLGTNNYTEIKGHPVSESREETIFKPIEDCLNSVDFEELLCLYTGKVINITAWNMVESHAYLDNNYFGWKLTATFRQEI